MPFSKKHVRGLKNQNIEFNLKFSYRGVAFSSSRNLIQNGALAVGIVSKLH